MSGAIHSGYRHTGDVDSGDTRRTDSPTLGRSRSRRLAAAAVFALGMGCAMDNAREGRASAATGPVAPPPLDLTAESPWPAEYTADPLWARAANGDDMDQARLARRENAETLLLAVAQGGRLARTALGALAYASDRRGALGTLCALLERANGASRAALLAALYDVVMDAPAAEEVLDPDADRRCPEILQRSEPGALDTPSERDRVQVLLARLQTPPARP